MYHDFSIWKLNESNGSRFQQNISKNLQIVASITVVVAVADYVTLSGICKRTGAGESELAVFLLGQLIDNGLDFTESYTSPTSVPV
jgi:hypothetical protein